MMQHTNPTCGKQPYSSRAEAEKALRLIRNRRLNGRRSKKNGIGLLRPYLCEDGCTGVWHLTSSPIPRPPRTDTSDDPTDITVLPRGRRNVPVASLIPEDPQ